MGRNDLFNHSWKFQGDVILINNFAIFSDFVFKKIYKQL